jgi:NAD(P)-dependent dehydrogenase (short-subunit alcohol dehydrogenase family)
MNNQVVVITGAASGLGRAAAEHLSSRGYRVLGGGLGLPDASLSFPTRLLDVRDERSVRGFFEWAMGEGGRIDALVNCAGVQIAGALEVVLVEEAGRIFDTNLMGTLRCCREVIPAMRARRAGRIVNVSSLGGRMSFPFHTAYCASKFAVEGLTECLRYELRPFGIHVSALAPGSFFTALAEKSECSINQNTDIVYADTLRRLIDANRADCSKSKNFLPFALKVEQILACKKPRRRYFAGRPDQGAGLILKRLLPDAWMEALVLKRFGME